MLTWLAKLLGIDMRSKYQHENDNECFNYDDFNKGMQKALDNLDAFDSITNPDRF